jgi:hypothetical protein
MVSFILLLYTMSLLVHLALRRRSRDACFIFSAALRAQRSVDISIPFERSQTAEVKKWPNRPVHDGHLLLPSFTEEGWFRNPGMLNCAKAMGGIPNGFASRTFQR